MATKGLAQPLFDDAQAFEPTGQIEWLGDSFLWIGALKHEGAINYFLIRQQPSRRAEFLTAVAGPKLCRRGAAPHLYAAALEKRASVQASGPQVHFSTLKDDGLALANCAFSVAREVDRLERLGVGRPTAVAIGNRVTTATSQEAREALLACRPAASGDASDLLLFEASDIPRSITVDWPLALDNPVLTADIHSGDWLAYPSLSFTRRQALKHSLPGIPVCRITREFELSLTWVPWDEWNESGPYRFYLFGSKLIGTTSQGWTDKGERLSGVYMMDDNRWQRRFSGQLDITSLAISADQKHLAWSEQVKVEPSSTRYGTFRQVARIEVV